MANSPSLTGRSAVITGSGRGIGLAIAEALAVAGAKVAIQDIDLSVAEAEAARMRANGLAVQAFGGDMSDLAVVAGFGQAVLAALGTVDILINNVAIQESVPWLKAQAESILRQYRCNVAGPILLAQLIVPGMVQRCWGRIINIGSIQQRGGHPDMLAYASTKAALANISVAWARDLAKHGILVNTIAPGWFDTHRNHANLAARRSRGEEVGRNVPLGRLGQPKDCVDIALLLCAETTEYITGQTFHIDGGLGL